VNPEPGVAFDYTSKRSQVSIKKKKPLGDDLLSQGVAPQVPSALTSLTTGFGMLPGVPSSLKSPRDFIYEYKD
jgi:hypothetical protein